MSDLRDLQRALALRLTQPSFALPVTRASSQFDTEESEEQGDSDPLQGIDPEELLRSRQVLFRKRLSQVRHLLPRTAAALAEQYSLLFRDYHSQHRFEGHRAPMLDAIQFANWLQNTPNLPSWKKELAKWESLPVQWIAFERWIALQVFHYNFDTAEPQSIPPKRRSLWIAWRFGKRGRIWRVV